MECAFTLQKESCDGAEVEDCTNYLDARMCAPQSNKMISAPSDGTQIYVVRKVDFVVVVVVFFSQALGKIKVGTWAKTSLREDATFVLRCLFRSSDGRTAEAVSSNFQVRDFFFSFAFGPVISLLLLLLLLWCDVSFVDAGVQPPIATAAEEEQAGEDHVAEAHALGAQEQRQRPVVQPPATACGPGEKGKGVGSSRPL